MYALDLILFFISFAFEFCLLSMLGCRLDILDSVLPVDSILAMYPVTQCSPLPATTATTNNSNSSTSLVGTVGAVEAGINGAVSSTAMVDAASAAIDVARNWQSEALRTITWLNVLLSLQQQDVLWKQPGLPAETDLRQLVPTVVSLETQLAPKHDPNDAHLKSLFWAALVTPLSGIRVREKKKEVPFISVCWASWCMMDFLLNLLIATPVDTILPHISFIHEIPFLFSRSLFIAYCFLTLDDDIF